MHKQEIIMIVVTILAVALVALAVIFGTLKFVNPAKYMNKSRDSQRVSDVAKLQTALDLYVADGHDFNSLTPNQIYNSNSGRNWLPIDFKAISSGAPISELPIDPLNNANFYYRVGVNITQKTYEIDCRFETSDFQKRAAADGGNNSDWYEIGTDLSILN